MKLRDKKLFLLDMDGTIYLGDKLFDGTLDFLGKVTEKGGRYMFLTNNSSKSVDKYIDKMKRLGISTVEQDYFTSAQATIDYLADKNYKKIYCMGTKSLCEEFRNAGYNIVTDVEDGIDCLVMGNDQEITFKKMEDACILLNNDIAYIATNPDYVCPMSYGYAPDCGCFAIMFEYATGKKPRFIGKPQPDMVYSAMKLAGCTPEETVLIGDRLYTDIACGNNAGVDTIFVLSGEGTMDDIEKTGVTPTYIYDNIRKVYEDII